jgi:predicted nucleotidyltransferase
MPNIRQKLLAATVLHPDKSWYLRELAEFLDVTPSSIQRELANLTKAGILKKTINGNRSYFNANKDCPIFPELKGVLVKTVGIVEVLRDCLKPFSKHTSAAFVYGSMASGTETSESDVDLFIVGEVKLSELAARLRVVENKIHRAVNPVVFSVKEIRQKLKEKQHFIETVHKAKKLFLMGEDSELGKTLSR